MASPTSRPKRGSDMSTTLYRLTDGQDMHRRHPDTFGVPTDAELAALRVGDFVKLGFQSDDDDPGERLWVEVTHMLTPSAEWGSARGRLANVPIFHVHLQPDMDVAFESRHVLAIGFPAPAER